MSLTDAEILELEKLLQEQEQHERIKSLTEFNELTSKNYKALFNAINGQEWGKDENNRPILVSGYAGFVLEGSSRCFHGQQLVKTINGSKPISELSKSDLVLTYNESTYKNEYKPVIDLLRFDNNKKRCLKVTLKSGETIIASEDHEFMFKGAWVSLKEILSFKESQKKENQRIDLDEILSVEEIQIDTVFDISVQDNHNYFIDNEYGGYLVHNSSKTFSGIFIIMYLCLVKHPEGCTINIYRETYNEFKTTLYDDFKRILNMFNQPNKFETAEEVKSFRIGKSKITFLGDGKHGGGCDYAFFNEAMMIKESVFNQVKMRCRKFWWVDYNPSFTQHWVFDRILKRNDVGYLHSTFKDNPFINPSELNDILSYEPWQPGSYTVEDGVIMYDNEPVTDIHQPPPHKDNIEQGTADEFMWRVYGLGLRGSRKGQIFKLVKWIDEFPKGLAFTYGLDFGFTCLAGDTLIETNKGKVKIKDIKKGDLVLTRKGYKRVLKRFDNGIKEVVNKRIDFDFGYKEISATLEHNFNVNNKWKKFEKLAKQETLCILSSSTVENTKDTQKGKDQTTILVNGQKTVLTYVKDFTEMSMNFIKGLFLKTWIFIISILTLSITTLIIFFVYLNQSTRKFIKLSTSTEKQINLKKTKKRTDIIKRTGKKEERLLNKNYLKKFANVIVVKLNTRLQTHIKDSAQANVITNGSIKQKLIRLRWNALCVVLNLWGTSILNRKRAGANARISYQRVTELEEKERRFERVYDLYVEDVHEYFANDILVHNCDPSALTKYAREGNNIYLELLLYTPTDTAEMLHQALIALGVSQYVPITADSADKYVSEKKGTTQMVRELFDRGWEITKVSKTKSVMYWLSDMKQYKIHIVKNKLYKEAKIEQENYVYKEVNGILINQPIDGFDHFFSSARYSHMAHDINNFSVDWD